MPPPSAPSGRIIPPPNMVVFGPNANCTFELCPLEMSVYRYRPSLPVNAVFIALYAIATIIHTYLGVRWKRWWFTACINIGCINAIIGYAGRIMLYNNPWSFTAFMIQIICITTGPVYYCAAIYITLSISISTLAPTLSRFPPLLFYWIFLPCDIISLILQAAGGAISTSTSGRGQTGVDLAIAGMAFQVFTILVFCGFLGDYLVRYFRALGRGEVSVKVFFGMICVAVVLTLGRCTYRLVELREGYSGRLIHDEGLFVGLEGVLVLVAVYCLMVGHPGWVFERSVGDVGNLDRRHSLISNHFASSFKENFHQFHRNR
ncbi:RTA1 like protein-domain-containing protein [Podospora aff. communis PSN243]|uniref:RTA1 like protein-domain-containing protein n=1 Tax=Podospora aff. communis PSN243 TaxID=3040156 RepID=A0AAV9GR79_9PEZI|nr:RTA1 like protein-domain-containing protein [Podospora aff. communis PSN243]